MSRRVLITGGGGFVGQWLARAAIAEADETMLAGLDAPPEASRILPGKDWVRTHWIAADMRRDEDLSRMVDQAKPDIVVHLAGISFVPEAERAPAAAYEVNVVGTVRLLRTLIASRDAGHCDPVVLIIGSGTQYGDHAGTAPLTEDTPQQPRSVYAATKAAQEVAALQLAQASGLRVICTRSFSHAGPGQASEFLLPTLVHRVRGLARTDPVLRIGNDVIRDYMHVEDVADAYLALAIRGRPGTVYNVCCGRGVRVSELAKLALQTGGVDGRVAVDEALKRPGEVHSLVGSPALLMADTGWSPRKTIEDIFRDLFAAS